MRTAFEITSFPDLSLPRYYDLFGEEALVVAATRLFTWLQLTASPRQHFSFTLRYKYDPKRTPSSSRLQIFVILSTPDDIPPDPLAMGQRLAGEVLDLNPAEMSLAQPSADHTQCLAILERHARLLHSESDALYLPALWTRQPSARNALEPYLDEAFAALTAPAFLDIGLHACEPARARQALRLVLDMLERRRQVGPPNSEDHTPHFQALAAALAEDPVCHLLICAGSSESATAEGLLRAFGLDAIGGARFKVKETHVGEPLYKEIVRAIETGDFTFADADAWFSTSLREGLSKNPTTLTNPQLGLLRDLSELSVLAGAELIRDVLTLPIPRRGFLRTFPLETEKVRRPPPISLSPRDGSLRLGLSLERQTEIELPLSDLTRHAFVAGVTGSGKTVTMFNILSQLGDQHLPFLVFEPAKAEYRALVGFSQLLQDLRVYTPGRDALSPPRFNPFAFDGHVTLANHIAGLAAAFNCALGLFQPVATILEEALWDLYEAKGWKEDDLGSVDREIPRVDQVSEAACRIIDSLGYDSEINGRFKGVIRSRFIRLSRGSVGRLFDCSKSSPSISDLCSSQSVIELRALTQQEANLVIMFMLTAIREHLSDSIAELDKPRLVMVLEEAHNLVPSVPDENTGGEEVSAKVEASRYVSNMLAEMRAIGLGILVVDQTPAAVAPQVVRNTNLKIAHRTVAKQDRETLADAMLMHPQQAELLGRLVPGQAYVYADRFYRPHLIQGCFAQGDAPLPGGRIPSSAKPPSDPELTKWLQSRPWFKEAIKARAKEADQRAGHVQSALVALAHKVQVQIAEWTTISDPVVWEATKRRLVGSWRSELRYWTQTIRSLEAEYRAALAAAKSLRIRGPSLEEVEVLNEMTSRIDVAIRDVDDVELSAKTKGD